MNRPEDFENISRQSSSSKSRSSLVPDLSREAVQEELQKIISSPEFKTSTHLKNFLQFAVEETLSGRADSLKEYAIGVEVFKRSDSFDPRIDTIVRTEARRLRLRLDKYYAGDGRSDPLRIELVRGSYVPVFKVVAAPEPSSAALAGSEDGTQEDLTGSFESFPAQTPQPAEPPASGRLKFFNWKLGFFFLASLFVAGALIMFLRWNSGRSSNELMSIVVTPFVNGSNSADDEMFCDALTDAIIDSLTKVQGLRVVARTSAFQYKGKDIDVRQVGEQLDVRWVLGGSVRKLENGLRINVQLSDTADGHILWSESYERDPRDLLAIQREMSQVITTSLETRLGIVGQSPDRREAGVDPEAYAEYLKGRYFWNRVGIENTRTAIEHFNRAIAIDPNFADAYMGLAHCFLGLRSQLDNASADEMIPKIRAAAMKALELDPTLGEVHVDLANISIHAFDWRSGRQELMRALELAPGSAYVHQAYATYLLRIGQVAEATAQYKEAERLDPLSPLMSYSVGVGLYNERKFDEAIAALRSALDLDPGLPIAHLMLGKIFFMQGKHDQGLAEFRAAGRLGTQANSYLAYGYAVSGEITKARGILADLLERSQAEYVRAVHISRIYLGLGEKDNAFAWLQKAVHENDPELRLKTDPMYDPLRSDPRFQDLLRQMNLN
jgi:TolB-like protein/Tfp pilus assembly protein PilF